MAPRERRQTETPSPGELEGLVLSYMAKHKGDGPLTASAISKGIDRSSGATANCLARLAKAGKVRQAKHKPRAYTLEEGSNDEGPRTRSIGERPPAAVPYFDAARDQPLGPHGNLERRSTASPRPQGRARHPAAGRVPRRRPRPAAGAVGMGELPGRSAGAPTAGRRGPARGSLRARRRSAQRPLDGRGRTHEPPRRDVAALVKSGPAAAQAEPPR